MLEVVPGAFRGSQGIKIIASNAYWPMIRESKALAILDLPRVCHPTMDISSLPDPDRWEFL